MLKAMGWQKLVCGLGLTGLLSLGVAGCQQQQQGNQDAIMKTAPAPPQAPPAPPVSPVALEPQLRSAARAELLDAADSDNPVLRCNALEALQDTQPDVAAAVAQRALSDRDI